MRAKDYLNQVTKARAVINGKLSEIQHWNDVATTITSHVETVRIGGQEYGMERVQKSRDSNDSMADAVSICVDAQDELVAEIKRYKDTIQEVCRTIEQLPAMEYAVVHGLYIEAKTLWEIADELDRSYSAITTAHGRALQDLDEILDEIEAGRDSNATRERKIS